MNWIEVISTLGFPIACCVALFVQNNQQQKHHTEETKELVKVIDNNSIILAKICTKLDMLDEEREG